MKRKIILFLFGCLYCGVGVTFANFLPTLIKIYDESEIDEYLEAGVKIERRRGDLLLCYFPDTEDDVVTIPNGKKSESGEETPNLDSQGIPSDSPQAKLLKSRGNNSFRLQKGKIITPALDKSTEIYNAGSIQSGEGFKTPFTGKGIVVGFCDIGFDPLHPTFLDANGHSRVKRITQYREREGIRKVIEGDEAYAEWITDSIDKNHATHVGGILAGGGANSPYQGIAYDSDIVVSLSTLTDFGLLMGVEDIIDYAKEVGKPAVINLSMGNYTGAHDGTSLFSQYLDLCGDDAIIVLSAGNEGNNTNTLRYNFSNSKPVEFRIGNSAWNQRTMYGMTDIWNQNDSPLKITVCIFDDETHEVVYEYEPMVLDNWDAIKYEWDPENPIFEGLSLDGYLILTGGIDPENGRYELGILYDYVSTRLIGSGWAKDMISFRVEGTPNDEIDVFADGSYTRLMGISGQPAPNADFSISDLVCGHRIVSVGMYTNRDTYPVSVFNEAGKVESTEWKPTGGEPMGSVVYSSYGTLRDGRVLPLTVGPGNRVVSSYSRPYRDAFPDEEYFMDSDGTPWIAMLGTSMSAPFVAGYIATWLEAMPNLTIENVLDMIEASNSHDIQEPDNPRNLNGYFNPVAALRYGLDHNGITQIPNASVILLPSDPVEIYNLTGMKVYSGRADGANGLKKGIYLVKTPYGVIKKILPS